MRMPADVSLCMDILYLCCHFCCRNGDEVPIYSCMCFAAIEVKHSAKVDRRDLHALKSFAQDFPEVRSILLYRGTERLLVDDVLCLPCEAFLQALSPGADLPR